MRGGGNYWIQMNWIFDPHLAWFDCTHAPRLDESDNLVASPSILKFASFAASIDGSLEIDASQRQLVKMTIVSVIEKLTVNP